MNGAGPKLALAALLLIGLQACGGGGGGSSSSGGSSSPPPADDPNPPSSSPTVGLDSRPSNATCAAWPRPNAGSDISLSRFTNLSFTQPVALLQAPNDSSRWFVVQQDGIVRQFSGANPSSSSVYIDISSMTSQVLPDGGEMGLLGMAFHPNYPTDPRVFLAFNTGENPMVVRVSSFTSSDGGATLNPASEAIVITVNKVYDNHNGGNIAFGPDGYLYFGVGDGGGGGDQHGDRGNGQRLTIMLGKLLRIDVNNGTPYAIPPTNPFAGNPVCPAAGRTTGECPEIYAYGFRNPWRWSFDRANGELWVGDVGQAGVEEIDQVTLGGNYGWRCREGAHDFNTGGTPGCSTATLIDPVAEYDHTLGYSVTGGYVYRGTQNTSLIGRYLFADFGSGRIFAWLAENATQPRQPTQLLDSNLMISSFGQGNDGELYVVHYGGTLHRIEFVGSVGSNPAPELLTETGCVSTNDPKQPASGLIPYAVNAPFWSDGADKDRWIALPNGQSITVQSDGDWNFPSGTVLMKNFRIGARLIETRLFMRHPDGVWGGFSYEWNAAQTQATLLEGGAVRDLGDGRNWVFPSEGQCVDCHTQAAGGALGLETAQLNRSFTYSQTNRTANELTTLNHIGVLTPAITDASTQPAMPDPYGSTGSVAERARAYLHTNCSQCHRPGATTPSDMDLRYSASLIGTNACDAVPSSGDLGLGSNARLIAPGSSANSLVVNRMNRRDSSAMPPLGSTVIDTAGVSLVSQWIDGLTACQ